MFIVKLGTGVDFPVDSVHQDANTFDGSTDLTTTCALERTPADHPISWYAKELSKENAIKGIVIADEKGEELIPAEDWPVIRNISMRLLPTGQRSISISLAKDSNL